MSREIRLRLVREQSVCAEYVHQHKSRCSVRRCASKWNIHHRLHTNNNDDSNNNDRYLIYDLNGFCFNRQMEFFLAPASTTTAVATTTSTTAAVAATTTTPTTTCSAGLCSTCLTDSQCGMCYVPALGSGRCLQKTSSEWSSCLVLPTKVDFFNSLMWKFFFTDNSDGESNHSDRIVSSTIDCKTYLVYFWLIDSIDCSVWAIHHVLHASQQAAVVGANQYSAVRYYLYLFFWRMNERMNLVFLQLSVEMQLLRGHAL